MERLTALHEEAKRLRDLAETFENPIIRNSLRTLANDCESLAKEAQHHQSAVEFTDTRQPA